MVRHLQRARVVMRVRQARRGDDGIALVAAIGVAIVALMLATTVVAVTVRSTTATGAGRDRDQAYAAAEAGIDGVTSLLMGPSSQWSNVCINQATAASTPLMALSSYVTTVTFWTSKDGATGYRAPASYRSPLGNGVIATGDVPCGSSASASYVRVDSYGTGGSGLAAQQKQNLTVILQLLPPRLDGVLGNNVDLSQAQYATLDSGTSGLGVRLATGDGSCGLYTKVHADVTVSSGKLVTDSYCHIYGSIKAAAGVTTGLYTTIDGSVLTKPGMPVVPGPYSTTGTVSTSASDPAWAATPLPRVTDTLDAWTSQGFTVRSWTGGCSVAAYATLALTQATRTIYDTRTTCPSGLTTGLNSVIKITGGDAVLLVNGFSGAGYFNFTSDTSSRKVWLIAPAPASGSYCPVAHDITLPFQAGRGTGVKPLLFLYSPCTVTLEEYAVMTGQVWGGTVTLSLNDVVTFADLGIPSASGGSGGVVRLSTS